MHSRLEWALTGEVGIVSWLYLVSQIIESLVAKVLGNFITHTDDVKWTYHFFSPFLAEIRLHCTCIYICLYVLPSYMTAYITYICLIGNARVFFRYLGRWIWKLSWHYTEVHRCRISFALIHSAIMCLGGSRSRHTISQLHFYNFSLALIQSRVAII